MNFLGSLADLQHLSVCECKLLDSKDIEALSRIKKLEHLGATWACPMQQKAQLLRPNALIPSGETVIRHAGFIPKCGTCNLSVGGGHEAHLRRVHGDAMDRTMKGLLESFRRETHP